MTTRIWIEPVKRPDGRNWYTDRNGLLRTRLGGPNGEVLCDRVHNAVCETCRVLMSRGIVGAFETWKVGIDYPCMTGHIASTGELTVHEPDYGVVHFTHWRPFDQNALSGSAVPSPKREEDGSVGENLSTRTPLCVRTCQYCRRQQSKARVTPRGDAIDRSNKHAFYGVKAADPPPVEKREGGFTRA